MTDQQLVTLETPFKQIEALVVQLPLLPHEQAAMLDFQLDYLEQRLSELRQQAKIRLHLLPNL
jgi:hypothetical protein